MSSAVWKGLRPAFALGFPMVASRVRYRSHVKFIRRLDEIVDTVIVPQKREIPVGTLRSILN